jgi:hypothetical protein
MEYNGKRWKIMEEKRGLNKRKYSKGGLWDYRLSCGWLVVCDRCVIVLCLLDPDLGPDYLMYFCKPLEPWPPVLLAT